MQTDEYVPQIRPTIKGIANALMESTPRKMIIKIENIVVSEVLMLRDSVSEIERLTTSSMLSFFDLEAMFSLIRSKITMVALIE